MDNLKRLIREVPDYPKPGILFYDITTLLKDAGGLKAVIDSLSEGSKGLGIQQVVGIEARGFIFGPCIARALGVGFVPIRKPKKLPAKYETVTYDLEYGTDSIAVHSDAIEPGQKILIVDDLLATGGTAAAAVKLVQKLGGEVAGMSFVVELDFLNGRAKLPGLRIDSLVHYDS
jgi:adenine phosphoribosyltransferase